MSKKISQREARRLKALVKALEEEKRVRANRYRAEYPGGTSLVGKIKLSDYCAGIVCGAARAGLALVAKYDESTQEITIHGVRQ